MARYRDLAGQRFGKIRVDCYVDSDARKRARWECQCECGKIFVTLGAYITAGDVRSCGCARRVKPGNKKHGHTGADGVRMISRTYTIWARMKQRCNDPHDVGYKHYGGRGIRYDHAWQDFEGFLGDMGDAPRGLTLDRIDNDGPYAKANCRWVSMKVQNRNSRHNVLVTCRGETKPISVWAEERQIKYQRLYERLYKLHWSVDRALEYAS